MIVKCRTLILTEKDLESHPSIAMNPAVSSYFQKERQSISIGQHYYVYGIILINDILSFYICNSERSYYPVPVAFAYFDIIDPEIPNDWFFSIDKWRAYQIVPAFWHDTTSFYEKLIDGDQKAEQQFAEHRAKVLISVQRSRTEWIIF